jgi:metal-responsive CopG/Arc/MetJ family transcriptional regulator
MIALVGGLAYNAHRLTGGTNMANTKARTRLTVTLPREVAAELGELERERASDRFARFNVSAFVAEAIRTALASERSRKVS